MTQQLQPVIKQTFPILQMSCASCAMHVEKTIKSQKGVMSASVNFATAEGIIEYAPGIISPENIRNAVQSIGYDMVIGNKEDATEAVEELRTQNFKSLKYKTIWAIVLSIPVVIIGMFFMDIPYANYIMWILCTPVVLWPGKDFYINAWKQFRHRSANMDTLVALSTGVAYLFSILNTLAPDFLLEKGIYPHVYFEAVCVIITFILLGRFLEEKAKGNTSSAIKKLIGLQPKTVTVVHKNGHYANIPIENVEIGNVILVKPGEKIAVDGSITTGSSYIDESMLSGESVPILKEVNDKVFAGTINQKGNFQFKAEKVGTETLLAQIIRMVQDAQNSKAPVQKLVDKIAGIFVPVVIAIAIISFLVWLILDGNNGLAHGFLALITVLVIACPCALGLATPTAIMVGMGKGAENGILIKDAESLEVARKTDAVVLDKTGTITEGKPVVTDILWLNDDDEKKTVLFSLEKQSEHPFAEAIVSYFGNQPVLPVADFKSITGKGAQGSVNGEVYYAGNSRLLNDINISVDTRLAREALKLSDQTKSVFWFSDSKQAIALIAIADKIKETSQTAVRQLQSAGIEVYMLTGDNKSVAKEIAMQAGIQHYKAEVLPREKAGFIEQLQAQGKTVAMIGDGINDSAALARADLSIAMGKGSDIAMDVAKMTIISSDLTKIYDAIKLSKQTVATIRQNLFWAFIYNLIGIPIAAGILYPINGFLLNPMIAGAAMALSSISVVCNSLRLKYQK